MALSVGWICGRGEGRRYTKAPGGSSLPSTQILTLPDFSVIATLRFMTRQGWRGRDTTLERCGWKVKGKFRNLEPKFSVCGVEVETS